MRLEASNTVDLWHGVQKGFAGRPLLADCIPLGI